MSILDSCKTCGEKIDRDREENKRLRSFCSAKCRNKANSQKQILSGYSRDRQRIYEAAKASVASSSKKKCGICGLWYKRVARHVYARHEMNAYEYKQYMQLPVSKGIMTETDRNHMSELALENKMDEQLKRAGVRLRFVLGGAKQRMKKPNAGKIFEHNEYF